MPGFFIGCNQPIHELEPHMTQTFSKSRQRAESAFAKTQSQFFAKDQAVEEQDFATQAREAKTARLREARLANETDQIKRATLSLTKMRATAA